jgi:hypothetical protein
LHVYKLLEKMRLSYNRKSISILRPFDVFLVFFCARCVGLSEVNTPPQKLT